MAAKIDPETRLNAYGVTTNGKDTIPSALQTYISEVVKAAREATAGERDGREGRY
jgi:hypothetical protein